MAIVPPLSVGPSTRVQEDRLQYKDFRARRGELDWSSDGREQLVVAGEVELVAVATPGREPLVGIPVARLDAELGRPVEVVQGLVDREHHAAGQGLAPVDQRRRAT